MTYVPGTLKIGIWNAWIFMSVFILQMVAMFLIDKRVWRKSHIPEEVKRKKFEKSASTIGNILWLLAMSYSIFLPLQLGTIWFYVGFSFFIVGLIFMSIGTTNFITTPADQLITKGVYKISRHPMYFSTFLICLGSGIATKSLLFACISIIMALCLYQEALIEDRYCLNKYGSVYLQYKRRTRTIIGVRKNNKHDKM